MRTLWNIPTKAQSCASKEEPMADYLNSISLTGVCASLAQAMGTERPAKAENAIPALINLVKDNTASGRVDRIFMHNPDAVAMWLYQKYTELFNDVVRHTQLPLPLQSVMPSVTPVCFGTMYTGASPAVHGIRSYVKPVIRIDTIFDVMIRAGKKVAVICDPDSSIGNIFLEREMDYFMYDDMEEITRKALELIDRDEHDMIVVYHKNYDSTMHKNGTEAEVSLQALKENVRDFDLFARAIKEKWQHHDTLIGFAMDHGCHDIDGGCGSHGLDMAEDLNIMHFYGVYPKK